MDFEKEFDIREALGIVKTEVDVELSDDETKKVEVVIDAAKLEIVSAVSQGERGMGAETQYTLCGEVETEEHLFEVEIDAWEYPIGALNHYEINDVKRLD